jgi:AcrR family transcriptional regulator
MEVVTLMTTRRERIHEATRHEILDTARRQMAASGAAALSLRAIAREMEITAPALYRYFPSRDDLVTALILYAYNSLADSLEAARDAEPADAYAVRLTAMALAYRNWALLHPEDFALIFGTPIPDYEAPRETTVPAATRNFTAFLLVIAAAMQAGVIVPPPAYAQLPPELAAPLEALRQNEGYDVPSPALYITAAGWSRMHGLVMLELFGHTGPVVGDTSAFYRYEMQQMLHQMGLPE